MNDFIKNNSLVILLIILGIFYVLFLKPKDVSKEVSEIKKGQEVYVEQNKVFSEQQKEFILSAINHKTASDSIGRQTIIRNNYYYEKIKDVDTIDSLALIARIRFALTSIGTISIRSTGVTTNTENR